MTVSNFFKRKDKEDKRGYKKKFRNKRKPVVSKEVTKESRKHIEPDLMIYEDCLTEGLE